MTDNPEIKTISGDDVDIANKLRKGEIEGPVVTPTCILMNMRITGTGETIRNYDGKQYIFNRPAGVFLSDKFLQMCNGLPVVWYHPENGAVDFQNWKDYIIGSIVMPYIKGTEVWGIAKIFDLTKLDDIYNGVGSTSPFVTSQNITRADGKIDEQLEDLNHVAIVPAGHWDQIATEPAIKKGDIIFKEETNMAEAEKKDDVNGADEKIDFDYGRKPDKMKTPEDIKKLAEKKLSPAEEGEMAARKENYAKTDAMETPLANQLMRIDNNIWNELKIRSGSDLNAKPELYEKYKQKVLSATSGMRSKSTSEDGDALEDNNFHSMYEILLKNGYFRAKKDCADKADAMTMSTAKQSVMNGKFEPMADLKIGNNVVRFKKPDGTWENKVLVIKADEDKSDENDSVDPAHQFKPGEMVRDSYGTTHKVMKQNGTTVTTYSVGAPTFHATKLWKADAEKITEQNALSLFVQGKISVEEYNKFKNELLKKYTGNKADAMGSEVDQFIAFAKRKGATAQKLNNDDKLWNDLTAEFGNTPAREDVIEKMSGKKDCSDKKVDNAISKELESTSKSDDKDLTGGNKMAEEIKKEEIKKDEPEKKADELPVEKAGEEKKPDATPAAEEKKPDAAPAEEKKEDASPLANLEKKVDALMSRVDKKDEINVAGELAELKTMVNTLIAAEKKEGEEFAKIGEEHETLTADDDEKETLVNAVSELADSAHSEIVVKRPAPKKRESQFAYIQRVFALNKDLVAEKHRFLIDKVDQATYAVAKEALAEMQNNVKSRTLELNKKVKGAAVKVVTEDGAVTDVNYGR